MSNLKDAPIGGDELAALFVKLPPKKRPSAPRQSADVLPFTKGTRNADR